MKKFRQILPVLLAIALVLSLFGCQSNIPDMQNSYNEVYEKGTVSLSTDANGTFRILKINDTHFINGTCEDDVKTLSELKVILDKTPCDLIVADGDLVEGANKNRAYDKYQAVRKFAELIESYEIPWTFAPGNNDGEKDGTNEDLIAFMLQYPHFLAGNTEGIDGAMQFFADIKYNDSLVHSVAILDSHARKIKAIGSYDFIKENQIRWLLDGIDQRKVPTSVFFHMPTPAFETAYQEGVAFGDFPFADPYPMGDIEENKLFDDMTKDNPYIALLSTGHVHSDNLAYFYNNRYYQLSSLSGYGAVGSAETAPSCTLTVIDCLESNRQDMYHFCKVTA